MKILDLKVENVPEVNLDDEQECLKFFDAHSNQSCTDMADSMDMTGPDAMKLALMLLDYAWFKLHAIQLRRAGYVSDAVRREWECNQIYNQIPTELRPW